MQPAAITERQALDAAIDAATGSKPARARRPKKLPMFKCKASVDVWRTSKCSTHPVATVRVEFYLAHMDDISGATYRARCALEDLGVPKDVIDDCYFEPRHDEYIALDAIGVRREYYTEPVEAFRFCEPKDRARLIRQKRLVPEDARERLSMYDPQAIERAVGVAS